MGTEIETNGRRSIPKTTTALVGACAMLPLRTTTTTSALESVTPFRKKRTTNDNKEVEGDGKHVD
jgi:hypothetical protein